jgi:tetratricopeptide (TPR) repeat protein
LLKIDIEELGEVVSGGDDPSVVAHIRRTESLLTRALQRFPGDEYLLDAEATFSKLFHDSPRAMTALKRAYGGSQRSPYIATRLARLYEEANDLGSAIKVLKDCLAANPRDKDTHYRLGRLLEKVPDSNRDEIRYHFREAFTRGDGRYDAQFWYARAEYLFGDTTKAMEIFRELDSANVPSHQKRTTRARVVGKRFAGSVDRSENSFGFIRKDGDGTRVYMRPEDCDAPIWMTLRKHTRVTFELAFNFTGPVAISVRLET